MDYCLNNARMGAICGDVVGSMYEGDRAKRWLTEAEFVQPDSRFTDDTVMTLAVAQGLMDGLEKAPRYWYKQEEWRERISQCVLERIVEYGRRYPQAGYGMRFLPWLLGDDHKPYGSFGNGSAMRASYAGWFARDLEEAEALAEVSAAVTHNHPDGIAGAKVVAGCIYLLRRQEDKEAVKKYAEEYYPLDFTLDEIRKEYRFYGDCAHSVPQAIEAFLEGKDFADTITLSISIGGDCDTIAAIAGSLAEVIYPISDELRNAAAEKLDDFLLKTLTKAADFIEHQERSEFRRDIRMSRAISHRMRREKRIARRISEEIWLGEQAMVERKEFPEDATCVEDYACYGCSSLQRVRLPSGVERIGICAFANCSNLREVQLSPNLHTISKYSFAHCWNLREIHLPDSLRKLEWQTFMGCYSLEEIVIPEGVEEIPQECFYDCVSLKRVQLPGSVKHIGSAAFHDCNALCDIVLPEALEELGDSAFYNCGKLTELVIPRRVTYIGSNAFLGCESLHTLVLPAKLEEIRGFAFCGCKALKKLDIPNGVKSIGIFAFEDCVSLTELVIPDSVETIGKRAFRDCDGLTKLVLPARFKGMGEQLNYPEEIAEYR